MLGVIPTIYCLQNTTCLLCITAPPLHEVCHNRPSGDSAYFRELDFALELPGKGNPGCNRLLSRSISQGRRCHYEYDLALLGYEGKEDASEEGL